MCSKKSAHRVVDIKKPALSPLVRISPSATIHFASPVGCHPYKVSPSNNEIHPSSSNCCDKNFGSVAVTAQSASNTKLTTNRNFSTEIPFWTYHGVHRVTEKITKSRFERL